MTRELSPIDISTMPEIARLAEEVRSTGASRRLRQGDEDVAILSPASARRRRKAKAPSEDDLAAFHAAAGSWDGLIDGDTFLANIAESRRSSRPPVKL
jgi:hypothetical protein